MTTPKALEGHARALQQVNERNGAAPYDLAITLRKDAKADLIEQAQSVLTHEYSLPPSDAVVEAVKKVFQDMRGTDEQITRAMITAYQRARKGEISG